MADYENQAEYADNIVDSTLEAIRDTRDDKQQISFKGTIVISPSLFNSDKKHLVQGPYSFESPFTTVPNMTFGQYSPALRAELQNATIISDYTPFLLQPYVYSWRYTNGVVDGFYIGLYAISIPTDGLTSSHNVFWRVEGEGTPYPDERTTESWTESYDYNDSTFLVDDGFDFDASGSGTGDNFPEGDTV